MNIEWMMKEHPRREKWRELIAEHKQGELSVKEFCRKHGVGEAVFYSWRKRLAEEQQPTRFALVATSGAAVAPSPALQLLLVNGDRLEIPLGVDGATLRTVLALLRERV